MRIPTLLFGLYIIFSCTDTTTESHNWPDQDRITVTWQLNDDAVEGDNKRTSKFIITNESSIPIPTGWQLFFNQFPTSFYLPAKAEMMYDISPMGGDLYRISTLDSFPEIPAGESRAITYQWPVGMVKNTHTPHGLFFVSADGKVHNVTNYKQEPVPQSLSFSNQGVPEPLHYSAEKRYRIYEKIKDTPLDKLNPVLPTPQKIEYGTGEYTLIAGAQILFDPGLEREGRHLETLLGLVLKNAGATESQSDPAIRLKTDTSGGIPGPEGYELSIDSDGIIITGGGPAGVFYGIQSLKSLIPPAAFISASDQIMLPELIITDAPRFEYRGQHVDVARNFQPVSEMKKIIDVMAMYKLNKLHFHLTDDEGWRLEIPGLPELTKIGSLRGYSPEAYTLLPPAYGSGGMADSSIGTGTGYYTRAEYIELLKYASNNHIEVIPEINGPGHARAAIIAMLNRYQRLMEEGKESEAKTYLLTDLEDDSQYSSAQNYSDNVICVCKESTYTFLAKVISELVSMYEEAGAPLNLIHTGGDEVPHGAWTKSPECQKFMENEPGVGSTSDLHPYFVSRYLDIAGKYGLKIAGWEEITLKHLPEGNIPNPDFLNKGVVSYAWNAIVGGGGEDMAYQLANLGYEVVMCNASNLYFDLAYTYEPEEPGLFWAGYIDIKNAFELTPSNIFLSITEDELGNPINGLELAKDRVALKPAAEDNIIGIQGALWSETIKSTERAEYMLLPKLLGLAERAWTRKPDWAGMTDQSRIKEQINEDWSNFANRVGKMELPRLDYLQGGYTYRISPPGAQIVNGTLYVNSEFPGLELRYTTNGTEPTPDSDLFKQPVKLTENIAIVKVRAFTSNGRGSRVIEVSPPNLN